MSASITSYSLPPDFERQMNEIEETWLKQATNFKADDQKKFKAHVHQTAEKIKALVRDFKNLGYDPNQMRIQIQQAIEIFEKVNGDFYTKFLSQHDREQKEFFNQLNKIQEEADRTILSFANRPKPTPPPTRESVFVSSLGNICTTQEFLNANLATSGDPSQITAYILHIAGLINLRCAPCFITHRCVEGSTPDDINDLSKCIAIPSFLLQDSTPGSTKSVKKTDE